MTATAPALVVEGLTKVYKGRTVVDALTFDVQPGRVTGFVGPNGAGKTTTLLMVLGLATPAAGSARFAGKAYREIDHPLRAVGAVLEIAKGHPGRSGRDELRCQAATHDIPDSRVDELLDLVGLADAKGRRSAEYSLGMRQRLALAGAMLGDPPILILDEPLNGLDPQGIRWMRGFMTEQAAAGKAILVSSHQLTELQHVATDMVVIHKGKAIAQGPVADLIASSQAGTWARSADPATLERALVAAGFSVLRQDGDGMRVTGATGAQVAQIALEERVLVTELYPLVANLEQAFFDLVDGPGDTGGIA
ncbi:ATP-binding cassette domain-containing protein [Paraconexibacter antarcticus]|uniref:ATP-binding cassette domain-containing protein n=1 Tax=Paraconexibacter antarcticus TaxID=2949664 RepID=A0ABY5DTL0_9ACTN|nr:ATP-binding cassette domain-containing protein [Paraconexibacter antarcticus]UTI64244.1 ATP-binding cassette domain-containing protein [Paraconexibacter antarcticus]